MPIWTTSKSEAVIEPRLCRSVLFHLLSEVPLMKMPLPLSARMMPYSFMARRTVCTRGVYGEMSKLALSRNRCPMGGSEEEVFEEASKKVAATMAALPTKALAFTKHALNYSAVNSLEAQLLLEDELQQKAAATKDYAEGVQAFLEKRPAKFRGE